MVGGIVVFYASILTSYLTYTTGYTYYYYVVVVVKIFDDLVFDYLALNRFFTPLASIISSIFTRLLGLEPSIFSDAYGDYYYYLLLASDYLVDLAPLLL